MADNDFNKLKEWIKEVIGDKIDRLSSIVEHQETTLRSIEIKTTTEIATIKKDIESLQIEIRETKIEQNKMGDSQKFKWRTVEEQKKEEAKERAAKELAQQEAYNKLQNDVNEMKRKFSTFDKMLWAIFGVALSILGSMIIYFLQNGVP